MSKMAELDAETEQRDQDTVQIYRVRSIAGETLIALPREYAGKVLAREVDTEGRVIFSPIRVVSGKMEA